MPLVASLLSQKLQAILVRDAESVSIDPTTGESAPGPPIPMQPNPAWCTGLAGKIISRIVLVEPPAPKTASNISGSVNTLVQTELTQPASTVVIDPLTGNSSAGPPKTLKPDQDWIDSAVEASIEHCEDMGYLVIGEI